MISEEKMTEAATAAGAEAQAGVMNTVSRTAPAPYVVAAPRKEDTEYTKRMKGSFGFFGPVTFLYAAFYQEPPCL